MKQALVAGNFWLYSHNFTSTGAPLVLAAIAKELAANDWRHRLRLISWGGYYDRLNNQLQRELQRSGLYCRVLGRRQLPTVPDPQDRILINTLALPKEVLNQTLAWLEQGRIKRLDWYAHEATPSLFLKGIEWPKRLQLLLQDDVLQMRVPSEHCLITYQNWLDYHGKSLAIQHPQIELIGPQGPLMEQPLPKFDRLKLQLTGMVGDGNKGHQWILSLIQKLLCEETQGLRPLELQFIGLDKNPHSLQDRELRMRAKALLGINFSWAPRNSRNQILAAMGKSNIAISCSRQETFSIVSVEAMALGQPLLRNRSGGWQEQLIAGVNGFDLGETGSEPNTNHVQLFQRLRDTSLISDAQLTNIAKSARSKAATFAKSNYSDWLLNQ